LLAKLKLKLKNKSKRKSHWRAKLALLFDVNCKLQNRQWRLSSSTNDAVASRQILGR